MSTLAEGIDGRIQLSKNDVTGIATISIDNPLKRNAINGQMMDDLAQIVGELEKWEKGKAVIVFGKNDFFCSGVDLTFLAKVIDKPEAGYSPLMVSTLTRLKSLPMLSIAVIKGMALGGGAEIAAACDLRLMARSAKIGFVHVRIGVSTAWSGGCRLVQICGPTKALDLLLSGRVLSSTEAFDLGLANHLLEDTDSEQLIQKAIEWVQPIITGQRDSIVDFKNCFA